MAPIISRCSGAATALIKGVVPSAPSLDAKSYGVTF